MEDKIDLTLSWFLFYGRKLGMSKAEILATTTGEMMDMLACMQIYSGNMKAKKKISMETILFDM